MAFGSVNHKTVEAPIGILAPNTWGDLHMMDTVINRHFPYAHEAALKRDHEGDLRSIREKLWLACCTEKDVQEDLPSELQSDATEMLKLMDIHQPEKVQTHTQRVTGVILSIAHRAKAAVF